MTFVDTNVFMYAVGRAHPLREDAKRFFERSLDERVALATSAEVLQELLHAYLPVGRLATLDAAWTLATSVTVIWPVEPDDVLQARALVARHPELRARDLLHLASCQRRNVEEVRSYDRALVAAWTN